MILTCSGRNYFKNGGVEIFTSAGVVVERREDVRCQASKVMKLSNEAIRFYMPLKFEII